MKRLAILLIVVAIPLLSVAQDVFTISLAVTKLFPVNANNQYLELELGAFADLSAFTYKLDNSKSIFTQVKDDTGYDMLAAQKKYEAENEKKGYSYQKIKIEYRGPISSGEKPGIRVGTRISVAPKPGAKTVNIKGVIAMINVAENEQSYTLKDIPSQYEWGAPGVQTEIGEVKIVESGSYSNGEVSFTKYQVVSDKPITSLIVAGGDDREEAAKHFELGLYGSELVFIKIPDKLEINVVAKDTEIKEIPFDLDLAIGF
jgi:hypothetical protein